ncbi:MAG: hypothetical protein WD077_08540, partial [Bacteroidia bacterium]
MGDAGVPQALRPHYRSNISAFFKNHIPPFQDSMQSPVRLGYNPFIPSGLQIATELRHSLK